MPTSKDNKNVFEVDIKDLVEDNYVPRYYWQKRIESIRQEGEKK
jgi:hypothetical protein